MSFSPDTPPATESHRGTVEPLPSNITSVQPGGGFCYQIELAWGRWRRWYLKTLRPGYLRRMAATRQGDATGAPHEILDPRDLKYCRNLCDADWPPSEDRFRWREKLPFARWGLAELQLMSYPLLALIVAAVASGFWYLGIPLLVVLGLVVYFFRDPPRRIPTDPGVIVAPADGKIVEIAALDHDPFVGGHAVRIGIFLSIFNVHINRAPLRGRVVRLRYWPGKFLNALNPDSAQLNESMWIGLEEDAPPYRRVVIRQIAGLFARRIVCALRPGEVVDRGAQFGMIKLGSRTELILPVTPDMRVTVKVGDKIQAGSSVLALYGSQE